MDIPQLIQTLTPLDGYNNSFLSDVSLYKASKHKKCEGTFMDPCVTIMIQGNGIVTIGKKEIKYTDNQYLILAFPVSLKFETWATLQNPLFEVDININMKLLHEVASKIKAPHILKKNSDKSGAQFNQISSDLKNATMRLLEILLLKEKTALLGESALKEIYYCILKSPHSASLWGLLRNNGNFSKITKTIDYINENFQEPFNIKYLSKISHMSESAFYKAFKEVTLHSPLQYTKNIRLDKACSLMKQQQKNVNETAKLVGYESVSQFSREFKRQFGSSPKAFINLTTK